MIRVVLVDDHQLVRAGLRTLIDASDGMQVVAEAADGAAAIDAVLARRPDVVLMDLSMPGVDGVAATHRLMAHPECAAHIVVLTSFADRDRVHAALEAGAVGYLLKDSDPRDVIAAIRTAAAGHAPIDPRVAKALLPRQRGVGDLSTYSLSAREAQVLGLVATGLANKQIARALGITERTVKAHLGSVFRQIGVNDRTSAALWARDHGFA